MIDDNREIKLEAIINAMFECAQKIEECVPFSTAKSSVAMQIIDKLYNEAEIRVDINDYIEIDVEMGD